MQGWRGHILKFGGDGIALRRQRGQTLCVLVVGVHMPMADPPGWAGGVWVQHRSKVAHALRGLDEHAPQLTATHHSESDLAGFAGRNGGSLHAARGTGQQRRVNGALTGAHAGGTVILRAVSVCAVRKSSSWRASPGFSPASRATANSAALAAPAAPMAKVATGTPLGICTML